MTEPINFWMVGNSYRGITSGLPMILEEFVFGFLLTLILVVPTRFGVHF